MTTPITMTRKTRPLGESQTQCLKHLKEEGPWNSNSYGWYWGSRSQTVSIMESLVRRGVVAKDDPFTYRALEQQGGVE